MAFSVALAALLFFCFSKRKVTKEKETNIKTIGCKACIEQSFMADGHVPIDIGIGSPPHRKPLISLFLTEFSFSSIQIRYGPVYFFTTLVFIFNHQF